MSTVRKSVQKIFHSRLCRNFPLLQKLCKKFFFRIVLRKGYPLQSSGQSFVLFFGRLLTGIRRPAGIHTKLRPTHVVSASIPKYSDKSVVRISYQSSESADLIGNQGIHRIHNNGSHATLRPRVLIVSRLASHFCKKRPHKTLRFTGTGTRCHK